MFHVFFLVLDLTAFLAAARLQDLIPKLQTSKVNTESEYDATQSYIMEMLSDNVKEEVIRYCAVRF